MKLRVSVALHWREPSEDGNQRDGEARYGGYNRQYVEMDVLPGGAVIERASIDFPKVQNHAESLTHFSFGDPNGGAVIIAGPIDPAIDVDADTDHRFPKLNLLMVGVKLDKLWVLGMVDADGQVITDRQPPASNIGGLTQENAADGAT